MESLQKHRTSLFNTFSKEFAEIDRDFRAELARLTRPLGDDDTAQQRLLLQAELEQCRAKASLVDGLEQESQRLRDELARVSTSRSIAAEDSKAQLTDAQEKDEHRSGVPSTGEVDDKPVTVPRKKYDELMVKYKHVNKRLVDMKNAHQILIAKSRKERENMKVWMQYLEQQDVQLKESWTAGINDRPPISSDAGLKEQERQDVTTMSRQAEPSHSLVMDVISDKDVDTRPRDIPVSEKESHEAIGVSRDVNITAGLTKILRSQESTQDDVEDTGRLSEHPRQNFDKSETAESESDLPVVVSERALKRKRPTKPDSDVPDNHSGQQGTVKDPIKVKSEHGSSSPIGLSAVQELAGESLDLDEVGWTVKTPRKRARLQELAMFNQRLTAHEASTIDQALQELPPLESSPLDENSPPDIVVDEDEEESRSPGGLPTLKGGGTPVPDTIHRLQKAGTSDLHCNLLEMLARSRSTPGGLSTTASHDTNKHESTAAQPRTSNLAHRVDQDSQYTRASSEPADAGVPQRRLPQNGKVEPKPKKMLEPKSNNLRVLQRSGNRTSGNNGPLHKLLRSVSAKVADVAEDGVSITQVTPTSRPSSSRLGVNTTITPEQGKSGRSKVEIQQRLGQLLERSTPSKQALRPGQTEPESISRNRKKGVEGDRANAAGESGASGPQRLRGRAFHLLELEDFRVNPNFNQGSNYAFTETVRNHERRRCLSGCTRPECCGNIFRKTIEIAGLPATRTSALRWNSSPPENEEDTLLEEFLGDDRDRLRRLTEEERKELVLQARTKQFADKHGRHRQAYERRKTPPGFWRTDMPTTQEIEADREEARKMMRSRVEERYREAMRPGGRWIFRDE
ncbi:MAG: hypothetical protein M1816_007645 [Peltula sp. TS41687]|nr:MAG: hypothetical protein M1816_007645 [Peltula sp. TS41687]